MSVKILFIGDVVGSPGRSLIGRVLPRLRRDWDLDLVVCNAENSAGGSGLTVKCHEELVDAGVDVITLGDHAYRRDEVHTLFARNENICRPANYPPDAPGADGVLVEARDGTHVGVLVVLGRVFMNPADCPFRAADRVIQRFGHSTRVILVDAHAEATSEKQLLGRYLDGRVSAVLGTHTHVPTADERILPGGTAYLTDVGMTGPYDSIIGRRIDRVMTSTLTGLPQHFDVATGDARLGGAFLEVDRDTGRALTIRRVMIDEDAARDPRSGP